MGTYDIYTTSRQRRYNVRLSQRCVPAGEEYAAYSAAVLIENTSVTHFSTAGTV